MAMGLMVTRYVVSGTAFGGGGGAHETRRARSSGAWLRLLAACGFALQIAACESSSDAVECRCPSFDLSVTVPADRVADIQTISATGPACSSISALGDGRFSVPVDGAGTCHITIVFRSAAPEFDTDVPFAPCSGAPCCASCGPQAPYAVSVPEAEAEGAAAAGDHG
jgi:hypothetical protein